MKVKIKKLHPDAKMPTQGTAGAAGFDLYATKGTMLVRGYPQKVPTGLAFEIPPGYVGVVYSRSSTAMKGIVITPLLVDADYRGEVFVLANYLCTDSVSYKVKAGDRIAQMRIEKLVDTGYEWADAKYKSLIKCWPDDQKSEWISGDFLARVAEFDRRLVEEMEEYEKCLSR